MNTSSKKIPVTVITGFLGSGKTTLINRILIEEHGIRFAVIENEFGEIGIDQDLVLNEKEEVIEMNNGCICCTVRGDLIRIIKKLVASERPPEHILIETTGLADPSPVAQTFLTDPDIAESTYLDGIVTVVDAKHIADHLINTPEAKDQIAFADVILLNKIDLITEDERIKCEESVREINRFAILHTAQNAEVSIKALFNIGGFDLNRALAINPKFLEIEYPFEYGGLYRLSAGEYKLSASPFEEEDSIKVILGASEDAVSEEYLVEIANPGAILFSGPYETKVGGSKLSILKTPQKLEVKEENTKFLITIEKAGVYALFTEHTPEEFALKLSNENDEEILPEVAKAFRTAHTHDAEVSSVGIEVVGDLHPEAFQEFVYGLTESFGNELYRYKGILAIAGHDTRYVLQGVHMLFEIQPGKVWGKDEERKNTIVFIGKNLNRTILTHGFLACKIS